MTAVLLDTHALLWWFTDDKRLSRRARRIITDRRHDVHVSAASAWEIATKQRLGKLKGVRGAAERYDDLMVSNGFTHLPITHHHALRAGSYESPHRDPFDRMLAAQSELESLPLVTADPAFSHLGTNVVW